MSSFAKQFPKGTPVHRLARAYDFRGEAESVNVMSGDVSDVTGVEATGNTPGQIVSVSAKTLLAMIESAIAPAKSAEPRVKVEPAAARPAVAPPADTVTADGPDETATPEPTLRQQNMPKQPKQKP